MSLETQVITNQIESDKIESNSNMDIDNQDSFHDDNNSQLLLENRSSIEAEKLHEHFRRLSFFENLLKEGGTEISELLLHEVWCNVEFVQMPAQQLIFKERDPSNNKMYIVLSGSVGINVRFMQEDGLNQAAQASDTNIESPTRVKKGLQLKDILVQNIKNSDSQQNTQRGEKETHKIQNSENSKTNLNGSNLANQMSMSQFEEQSTPLIKSNYSKLLLLQQHQQSRTEDNNQTVDSMDDHSDEENSEKDENEEQLFPELGKKLAELSSGQAFGDQALFKEGGVRNASVYTLEASSFLVIRREKFLGVLEILEKIKQDKVESVGRVIPFFNDIVSKSLKDRLLYEFEDVNFLKGNLVTQEHVKGNYIYVLKSGRVAIEKSIELVEYKEKECLDTKKITIQHRFSEFTTAQLIGDEIMEEKNKIYLHKSNICPQEYHFTSIVLSIQASFFRVDKRRILERFPKYIVNKLRDNVLSKLQSRKAMINEYIEKVQPNFVENHRKQINQKKNLLFRLKPNINTSIMVESSPLSQQNGSPNKKVQFQHIVRDSILPIQEQKKDIYEEETKSLIKELSIIQLRKQKSLKQNQRDSELFTQPELPRNSLNHFSHIQNGLDDPLRSSLKSLSTFSQQNSNILRNQDSKYSGGSNEQDTSSHNLSQNNINQFTHSKSSFGQKKLLTMQSVSLNEVSQLEVHQFPQSVGQNYFPKLIKNITSPNCLNTSDDISDETEDKIKSMIQPLKLRQTQSIPSLTTLNKVSSIEQKNPLPPPFAYNHGEQIQKQNKQKKKQELQQQKTLQQAKPVKEIKSSSNIPSTEIQEKERQKKEAITEERDKKLLDYKNQHNSQISKKIDSDIMKKEIIYQHMKNINLYKQIDPFEDTAQKKQQSIQNEMNKNKLKSQTSIQNTQVNIDSNTQNSFNKKSDGQKNSLHPIKETNNEEITSKQFISVNGSPNKNQVTFSNKTIVNNVEINSEKFDVKKGLKLKSNKDSQSNTQSMTDRSKSSQAVGSTSIINEEPQYSEGEIAHQETEDDRLHKNINALQGNNKKKFYMLVETWDMGVENLKMKELDLRNGLYRKGMIHKPPLEQSHKECFEKLDEHQVKNFQKYLKKKQRKNQKELRQIQSLVTIIPPEQKQSLSPQKYKISQTSSQPNINQLLGEINQDNNEQKTHSSKQIQFLGNSNSLNDLNIVKKKNFNDIQQLNQSTSLSNIMITHGNSYNNINNLIINSGRPISPNFSNTHFFRASKAKDVDHKSQKANNITLPEISPQKKVQKFLSPNQVNKYSISLKSKTESDQYHEEQKPFQNQSHNALYGLPGYSKNKNEIKQNQFNTQNIFYSHNTNSLISPSKQQIKQNGLKNQKPDLFNSQTDKFNQDSLLTQKIFNAYSQTNSVGFNKANVQNPESSQPINVINYKQISQKTKKQ